MAGDCKNIEAFSKNKGADARLPVVSSFHADALMNGLNTLRDAGKLFDVSLVVEGRTFKAHRVVLAACSDYFCAMFSEPMLESRQFEISLKGVSALGIELLLEYIYTSTLELNRNNIQDVLSASNHLQMHDVVDACSNYLESQIDLENCVSVASLAELYSLEILKKRSYRYICSHLSKFAYTSDLLTLTWDQMEYILASNNPVDCSEERVLEITLQYCLESKLKLETACRLITNIRFDEISKSALKQIANNLSDESKTNIEHQNKELTKALSQFICTKTIREEGCLSNNRIAGKLSNNENNLSDILINSRGMELTLVKIGGFLPNGLTNEISCFSSSKRKWENLTVIPHIDQCNYGTAVLGNDLYVVGGSYDVSLKEYTHPFGFCYCPSKSKWKTIAPIQADRCAFSLNAMGKDYLYAVGGLCESNDGINYVWRDEMLISSNCERYNAVLDKWEFMPPLIENRSQHAGVVLGEKLYISGGINRDEVLSTLWCFDTTTQTWSKLASMPTPRADHVLITFDGSIYACGGWYEDETLELRVLSETIDIYDVECNQWTSITQHPMPKYYAGVAVVGHKIFFVGGLLSTATINRCTASVHCYDLETKTWSTNSEWEYPQEVWECTCIALYVPTGCDDIRPYCSSSENDSDREENNSKITRKIVIK